MINIIKNIREDANLSRKQFSVKYGIPVRTLEEWEAGRRKPPEYLLRMMAYCVKYDSVYPYQKEEGFTDDQNDSRNINIVVDTNGNKIAVIHDIIFRGKQHISWDAVEKYMLHYVDEFYQIAEYGEVVYIGKDLPDEYARSNYTAKLRGALAKANAATAIPEMIQISTNSSYLPNYEKKHSKDAKYGWYRYDTRFALAVYGVNDEVEKYNVYRARMVIRHDEDGKKYLYDLINIKKETEYPV